MKNGAEDEDLPDEFYEIRDAGFAYSRAYMEELRDAAYRSALLAFLDRIEAEDSEPVWAHCPCPGDERHEIEDCLAYGYRRGEEPPARILREHAAPRLRRRIPGLRTESGISREEQSRIGGRGQVARDERDGK